MQPSDDDARDARIGAILNDLLDRRARGERVNAESVLARYPDLASELRADLDLVRELRPTDSIAELVDQGLLAPASDPRYRAELGAYRIVGFIGRGGMGIVLKAYEESLNRTVALKILRPELGHDPSILARFEREARAAAALQHPNIVTIYAVGRERGVHFIAMEYVEGQNLAELVRAGHAFAPELIRRIMRELLTGLAAAHAADLIHRDIKSSNILLAGCAADDSRAGLGGPQSDTQRPLVRIADFGLARVRSAETRLTLNAAVLGTPEYMSPEQARGAPLDARSDLYSAGVVLYELLTGGTPFRTDTPSATIHRILHEEPRDPHQLNRHADRALCDLARRLMAKQPGDRFASAADALAALESQTRIRQLAQERRWRLRLLGVAAIAAFCLGLGSLLQRAPSGPPVARELSAVWTDPQNPTTIWGRFGADQQRVLRRFPATCSSIAGVVLVHPPAAAAPLVVVGYYDQAAADCLLAFDADGREHWRLDLSSPLAWPDCGPPTRWRCTCLRAADIDGIPGDELIVAAKDTREYPARLSLVDPVKGTVRATFWNFGELRPELIVPDYFGPGHPAILASGLNNKLDGFDTDLDDPPPVTSHDIVPVAAVLDPWNMDGVSPPHTSRLPELPPGHTVAYAFLDAPPMPMGRADKRRSADPSDADLLRIASFGLASTTRAGDPELLVRLERGTSQSGPGNLLLDRDLEARGLIVGSGAVGELEFRALRRLWRPLVQSGRPVPNLRERAQLDGPTILEVLCDPGRPRTLLARVDGFLDPVELHQFEASNLVRTACAVDLSGRGDNLAVAGLDRPDRGRTLLAFDSRGRERWGLALDSDLAWPDCGGRRDWISHLVYPCNVDGLPGEELIVVSHDSYEYPTRVDCVDPRTGTVRGTFWHFGHIHQVALLRNFFGPTHHALSIVGCNNKLDGFYAPLPAEEAHASWEIVNVVMILDPRALDGLGPPRTRRLPIPPAKPHAYAFLDLSASMLPAEPTDPPDASNERQVTVCSVEPASVQVSDDSAPWLAVRVQRHAPDARPLPGAVLIVDRHLRLRDASISQDEKVGRTIEYWRERWRTLDE